MHASVAGARSDSRKHHDPGRRGTAMEACQSHRLDGQAAAPVGVRWIDERAEEPCVLFGRSRPTGTTGALERECGREKKRLHERFLVSRVPRR